MEEEKEYILRYYDGRVRRVFGKRSQFLNLPISGIEEAPQAFNPLSNAKRDVDRINSMLGEGFVQFQRVVGPRALLDRIEASLDTPAAREVMDLPRRFMIWPKFWPDKIWRRRE